MPVVPVALAAVIWIHLHILHFAASCLTLTLRKTIQQPVGLVHSCAKLCWMLSYHVACWFDLHFTLFKSLDFSNDIRTNFSPAAMKKIFTNEGTTCSCTEHLSCPPSSPKSDILWQSACECYFTALCQRRKAASSWASFHDSVTSEAWGVKIKVLISYFSVSLLPNLQNSLNTHIYIMFLHVSEHRYCAEIRWLMEEVWLSLTKIVYCHMTKNSELFFIPLSCCDV